MCLTHLQPTPHPNIGPTPFSRLSPQPAAPTLPLMLP